MRNLFVLTHRYLSFKKHSLHKSQLRELFSGNCSTIQKCTFFISNNVYRIVAHTNHDVEQNQTIKKQVLLTKTKLQGN